MPRSLKKGPFIDLSLQKAVDKQSAKIVKSQLKHGPEDL